ncbi:MAG TPA: YraN family protein [Dokdonella sp.]
MNAREDGARFEDLALAHLEHAGLALIERNYACRFGELDLVMRDRDVVVFVEVRYRRASAHFGDGVDSVGPAKRAKLARAAAAFLAARPRLAQCACRFDVVAIGGRLDAPSIDWRRGAFEAG